MNDFKVIYKILRFLEQNMGNESCDLNGISPDALGIAEAGWEQLLIALQEDGYIKGMAYSQTQEDKFPHLARPITPRITLRGLEYLKENSMMKKAEQLFNGVVQMVK